MSKKVLNPFSGNSQYQCTLDWWRPLLLVCGDPPCSAALHVQIQQLKHIILRSDRSGQNKKIWRKKNSRRYQSDDNSCNKELFSSDEILRHSMKPTGTRVSVTCTMCTRSTYKILYEIPTSEKSKSNLREVDWLQVWPFYHSSKEGRQKNYSLVDISPIR